MQHFIYINSEGYIMILNSIANDEKLLENFKNSNLLMNELMRIIDSKIVEQHPNIALDNSQKLDVLGIKKAVQSEDYEKKMAELQAIESLKPIYQGRVIEQPQVILSQEDLTTTNINLDKEVFEAFLQLAASARYGEPSVLFPDYNSVANDTNYRQTLEQIAVFDNDTGLYQVKIDKIRSAQFDETHPLSLQESMAFLFDNQLLTPPNASYGFNPTEKAKASWDYEERLKFEQSAREFADLVNNRSPRQPSVYLQNPLVAKSAYPNPFVAPDAYFNVQPQNFPFVVIPPLGSDGKPDTSIKVQQVPHKPVLIYPDAKRYVSDYQYRDYIKQIAKPTRLQGVTVFEVTEDNLPKRYANADGSLGDFKLAKNKNYIELYLNYKLTGKQQRESQSKAAFIFENGLDKIPTYEQMKQDSYVFETFLEMQSDYQFKRNQQLASDINMVLVKPGQSAYRPPSIPVESSQAAQIQRRLFNKAMAGKLNEAENVEWQQLLDYKRLGMITEWVENNDPNSKSYGRRRFVDNIQEIVHQDFPSYLATGGTILEFINQHKLYEFQGNKIADPNNRPELKRLEDIASSLGYKQLLESTVSMAEAFDAFGEADSKSLKNVKRSRGWLTATVYGSERNGGVAISDKGFISISSFRDGNITFNNGRQATLHPKIQDIVNDYYAGKFTSIKQHLEQSSYDKWLKANGNNAVATPPSTDYINKSQERISVDLDETEESLAQQFTKQNNFKELQTFINGVFNISKFQEDKLTLDQNYYLAETKGFVDFSQVGPDVLLIKNDINNRQKTFFEYTLNTDRRISTGELEYVAARKTENGKQVKDGSIQLKNNDLITRLYRFDQDTDNLVIAGGQHISTEKSKNAHGSYQFNTTKNHIRHTEKKGAFTVLFDKGTVATIDELKNDTLKEQQIIFVEGQATGFSVKKLALNSVVVFYGDAHNLEPVLEEWVSRFGDKGHNFIVAADNDHANDKLGYFANVGKSTAVEAVSNIKAKYGDNVNVELSLPDFASAKQFVDQELVNYKDALNQQIERLTGVNGNTLLNEQGYYEPTKIGNLEALIAQKDGGPNSQQLAALESQMLAIKFEAANTATRRSYNNAVLKGSDFNDLHKNIVTSSPQLIENDLMYREQAQAVQIERLHENSKVNDILTKRKRHEYYREFKREGEAKEFAKGSLLSNIGDMYFAEHEQEGGYRASLTNNLLAEYKDIRQIATEFDDIGLSEKATKEISALIQKGQFPIQAVKQSLVEAYESKAAVPIAEQLVAKVTSSVDLNNNQHYGRLMLDVQSFTKDDAGHIYANGIINNSNISVGGGYQPKTASIRLRDANELRSLGMADEQVQALLERTESMEVLIGKRTDAQGTQMLGNSQLVLAFKNLELEEISLQKNSLNTQFTKQADGKINYYEVNAVHLKGVANDYLNLVNTDIKQAANPKTLHNNAMATLNFVSRGEANALTTSANPYLQLDELHGVYETTSMGQDKEKILQFLIDELEQTDGAGNLRRGRVEIKRAKSLSANGELKEFHAPLYIHSDIQASEQAIAVEDGGFIKTTIHTPIGGLDTLFNIVVREDRRTNTAENKIGLYDLDNVTASDIQSIKSIASHIKHIETVRDFLFQSGLSELIVAAKEKSMGLEVGDLSIDPAEYINKGSFFDNRYNDLFLEELDNFVAESKLNQEQINARMIGTTVHNLVGNYNSHIAQLIQSDYDAIEQGKLKEITPIMKMVNNGIYQHTSYVTETRQDDQVNPVVQMATNYLVTADLDASKADYVWHINESLNKLSKVLNNTNSQGAYIQTEGNSIRTNWLHAHTNLGFLAPNSNINVNFQNPQNVMRFVPVQAQRDNFVRSPIDMVMTKNHEPLGAISQLDSFYDFATLRNAERKLKTHSLVNADADVLVDMLGKKMAINPTYQSIVKHIQTLTQANIDNEANKDGLLSRDEMVNDILAAATARQKDVTEHFKGRKPFIKGLGRNDNTAALFVSGLLDEQQMQQLKDYINSDPKLATERNIQGLRELFVARELTLREDINTDPKGFDEYVVAGIAGGLTAQNNPSWQLALGNMQPDQTPQVELDLTSSNAPAEQDNSQTVDNEKGNDIGLTSVEQDSPTTTPTTDEPTTATPEPNQADKDYQFAAGEALAFYLEMNEFYPTDNPQKEWVDMEGMSSVLEVGQDYRVNRLDENFELIGEYHINKDALDNANFAQVHQLLTEAGLSTTALSDDAVLAYVNEQDRLKQQAEQEAELDANNQQQDLDSEAGKGLEQGAEADTTVDNSLEEDAPTQGGLFDDAAKSTTSNAKNGVISQQFGDEIIGRRTDKLAMITADVFAKKGISAWGMNEINKIQDPYIKAIGFILRDSIPEKPRKTRTFSSASTLRKWAEDAAYRHELFTEMYNNHNALDPALSDDEKTLRSRTLGLTTLMGLQGEKLNEASLIYSYNMARIARVKAANRSDFIFTGAVYEPFIKAEVLASLPQEQWQHISVKNRAYYDENAPKEPNPLVLDESFEQTDSNFHDNMTNKIDGFEALNNHDTQFVIKHEHSKYAANVVFKDLVGVSNGKLQNVFAAYAIENIKDHLTPESKEELGKVLESVSKNNELMENELGLLGVTSVKAIKNLDVDAILKEVDLNSDKNVELSKKYPLATDPSYMNVVFDGFYNLSSIYRPLPTVDAWRFKPGLSEEDEKLFTIKAAMSPSEKAKGNLFELEKIGSLEELEAYDAKRLAENPNAKASVTKQVDGNYLIEPKFANPIIWAKLETSNSNSLSNIEFREQALQKFVEVVLPKHELSKAIEKEANKQNNAKLKKTDVRNSVDSYRRVGDDYDFEITDETILRHFGFSGVEFSSSNYIKPEERAVIAENTLIAYTDMARIIGLPTNAIGLGGELGLTIGRHGNGSRAAAFYDPRQLDNHGNGEMREVGGYINITRSKGLGVLAHEFAHALDNYLIDENEKAGNPKMPSTLTDRSIDMLNMRDELKEAYKRINKVLQGSGMAKRSRSMDGTSQRKYWADPAELFARGFEAYVKEKAAQQGMRNDFLVNVRTEEEFVSQTGLSERVYPYPTKEEMPEIMAAYDDFLSNIKQKTIEKTVEIQTPDGKKDMVFETTALFSRVATPLPPSQNIAQFPLKKRIEIAVDDIQHDPQKTVIFDALSERFGEQNVKNLLGSGLVEIATKDEIKQRGVVPSISQLNGIEGFYSNGKSVLIADNLNEQTAAACLLHELGGHHGFQRLMSPNAYQKVMNDIQSLIKDGNPIALEAQRRAMHEKTHERQQQELLPYMLTVYESEQLANPQQKTAVEKIIENANSEMKLFLNQTYGFNAKFTPHDLVLMAEGAIKDMAEKSKEFDQNLSADILFSRAMPRLDDSMNIKVPLIDSKPNDAYRRVYAELSAAKDERLLGVTDNNGRTTHYNFTQFVKEDFAPAKRGDDITTVANPDIHHLLLNGGTLEQSKAAVANILAERTLAAEKQARAQAEQEQQASIDNTAQAEQNAPESNNVESDLDNNTPATDKTSVDIDADNANEASTDSVIDYTKAYIEVDQLTQPLSKDSFKQMNAAAMAGFKDKTLVDNVADVVVIYSQNEESLNVVDVALDRAMGVNDNQMAQDALIEFKTRLLAHKQHTSPSNPTIDRYGLNENFANMMLNNIVQKAAYNPKDNTGVEAVQALNASFAKRTPELDFEAAKAALKDQVIITPKYDKQQVRELSGKIRNGNELDNAELDTVIDIMTAQYRNYPQATERLFYGATKVHENDILEATTQADLKINDEGLDHLNVLHKGLFTLATKDNDNTPVRELVNNTARYELVASVLSATMNKAQAAELANQTEHFNSFEKLNPLGKIPKEPSSPFELADYRSVIWVERFIADNNHKSIKNHEEQRKAFKNVENINERVLSKITELSADNELDKKQDNGPTPTDADNDMKQQVGQGGVFDVNVQDYVEAYLTNKQETMQQLQPKVDYFKNGDANKMVNEFIDIACHDTAVNNHLRRALVDANIKEGNALLSYPTTQGLVHNKDFAKVASVATAAVMQVVKHKHVEDLKQQGALEPDLIAECQLNNSLKRREFNHRVHGKDGTLQDFNPILVAASRMAITDHAVGLQLNIEPKELQSVKPSDDLEVNCDDDLATRRAKCLLAAVTISNADMKNQEKMAQKLHMRDIVESSLKAIGTEEALKFVKYMKATNPNAEHYQDLQINGNMANNSRNQVEAFGLIKAMLNESAGEIEPKATRVFNHATRYGAWTRDIDLDQNQVHTMQERLMNAPTASINSDFSFLGKANKLLEDLEVVEKVTNRYVNSKILGEYKPVVDNDNQGKVFEATLNELMTGMNVNHAILDEAVRIRAENDAAFAKTAKMLGELSVASTAKDIIKLVDVPATNGEPQSINGWDAIKQLSDMTVVKSIMLDSKLNSYERYKSFEGLSELASKIAPSEDMSNQIERFKLANDILAQTQQRQSNNDASFEKLLETNHTREREVESSTTMEM